MTDNKDVITGWVDYIVDNLCHKIDEVNEYKEYYVWFTAKGWYASTDNPYPNMDPKRPWFRCRAASPKDAEDKALEYYKTFTPINMQRYDRPVMYYAWYTPSGWVATSSQEPPPNDGPWSPLWRGYATCPAEACTLAELHYDKLQPPWYTTVHSHITYPSSDGE